MWLKFTIESFDEIEELPTTLAGIEGLDITSLAPDEGSRFLGFSQIAQVTAKTTSSMRDAVRIVRDTVKSVSNLQRAEVEIDGRTWAISELTDKQIDEMAFSL